MRNNTPGRRSISSNQPQENSSNPKVKIKDSNKLMIGTNQGTNSASKVTEEAIDVLSFVGFKL